MTEYKNVSMEYPKIYGTLEINEGFKVCLYRKLPNRFYRMMARILLGWKYEEYKDDKG